jgi:hypothetical protein
VASLLAQLLDANLSEGVAAVELVEETVEFGDLAGPAMRAERTAFAEALSGTSDKQSRAYKAARRNVERWVAGRRPMRVSVRRIVSARRQQGARLTAIRAAGADVRLQVSWYATRRPEWLPPHRWLHIARDPMRRVVRHWADGDHELAAGALFTAFARAYNVPNIDDWMRDVEVVDLALRPTDR